MKTCLLVVIPKSIKGEQLYLGDLKSSDGIQAARNYLYNRFPRCSARCLPFRIVNIESTRYIIAAFSRTCGNPADVRPI